MKIKGLYAGLPGASFNPLLPDVDDGVSGGTNGGGGAPVATPPAPVTPSAPAVPPAAGAPAVGPNGFPESTPLAEMTVEQREAYHKHWNRQNRTALEAAQARLAELEPKAQQYDALAAASQTDHERAIEAARTEAEKTGREAALAEARKTYGAQLVQVRLDAALAAKGLTTEAMTALVGDKTRFLGADGLDAPALDAFLAALPDKATAPVTPPRVDLGGGRTTAVSGAGVDAGRALYEERKSKPRI